MVIDAAVPLPGLYKLKLRQGGPWRPAKIERRCCCTIQGRGIDQEHDWSLSCDRYPHHVRLTIGHLVEPEIFNYWPWLANNPIEAHTYRYLMDLMDWDAANPEQEAPAPEPPRDLLNEESIF